MRIVAGKWGGRTLRAPRGMAVRPTTDRVREALFSILGDRVEGRAVLDLFAGTGALSIEAMSRGASSAFLAEPDPDAFAAMTSNLATVGAAGADTFKGDFRKAIKRLALHRRTFGLVFLDPPYGKGLAAAAAKALSGANLLPGGALVVVEEASRLGERLGRSAFPKVDRDDPDQRDREQRRRQSVASGQDGELALPADAVQDPNAEIARQAGRIEFAQGGHAGPVGGVEPAARLTRLEVQAAADQVRCAEVTVQEAGEVVAERSTVHHTPGSDSYATAGAQRSSLPGDPRVSRGAVR